MNSNPADPQLVIVLKNTTLGPELRAILEQAARFDEPLRVALDVAGHKLKVEIQVLHGPAPVFGGPSATTTMALCALEPKRLPVQET